MTTEHITDRKRPTDTPAKVWAKYMAVCERQRAKPRLTLEDVMEASALLTEYNQARERHPGQF